MRIYSFIKSLGKETAHIKQCYDSNYAFKNTKWELFMQMHMQISVILGEFPVGARSQNVWIKYSAIRHAVKQNVMKFHFDTIKDEYSVDCN